MREHEFSKEPKTAIFCYGRMNPPTIGHEMIIKTGLELAETKNADFFVFPSHSYSPEKILEKNTNPLPLETKLDFLKEFFPQVSFITENIRSLFDVLTWIANEGYERAYMLAGNDRASNFEEKIRPYIPFCPSELDNDPIGIEFFEVLDVGKRNPKSTGVKGASGSKARKLAIEGKKAQFMKIIPEASAKTKELLYNELRKNLGATTLNDGTNSRSR